MKMEIVRIDEVEEARTPRKIEVRKVLRKKDVQVVYLKFKPGKSCPPHHQGGRLLLRHRGPGQGDGRG